MTDGTSAGDPGDLGDLEATLRALGHEDLADQSPPPAVWAAIEAGLAEGAASILAAAPHMVQRPGEPSPSTVRDDDLAPVTPIGSRPDRRRLVLAVAAVSVVVLGGLGTILALRGSAPDDIVATASLVWRPGAFDPAGEDASAGAELIERDGHYEIRLVDVDLPRQLDEPADLELWMIALDPSGGPADIVPVALVDPSRPGTYRVPDGVDLRSHDVIDISIEPRDDDAHHSGRSIVRGSLAGV